MEPQFNGVWKIILRRALGNGAVPSLVTGFTLYITWDSYGSHGPLIDQKRCFTMPPGVSSKKSQPLAAVQRDFVVELIWGI